MQCQSLIAFVAVVPCTQLTPCQEAFGSEVSNDLVIATEYCGTKF